MQNNKIASSILIQELLKHFRFCKKYYFVCTEALAFSADFLATKGEGCYLIECETKISKTDLTKDFKKHKHSKYADYEKTSKYYKKHIPNYFYFVVPISIKDFALKKINENNIDYGLIIYDEDKKIKYLTTKLTIIKEANLLHENKLKKDILLKIIQRMGSEIFCKLDKINKLKNNIKEIKEKGSG
jgi:hypothetical protein